MNAKLTAAVAVLLSVSLFTCVGNAPANRTGAANAGTANKAAYFTGDGGKGKSITILPPRGVGLAANQAYLPDFVANELVSNFNSFSAMSLFDRVSNQKQYDELLSGFYADDDAAGLDLGHLSSTDYMLLGDITRTSSGYALQLAVNSNRDKKTVASYSAAVSVTELDNLSGVRRASLDLLQKIGVQVTERAKQELSGAAAAGQVNAQAAMAQGIVAQRGGNEFEAMTNFFRARTFNPALPEAPARTVSAAATIAANKGANTSDLRGQMLNAIQAALEKERLEKERIKNIAELLKQATAFYRAHQPFTISIADTFAYGNLDVKKRTVDIGVCISAEQVATEFEIILQLAKQAHEIQEQVQRQKSDEREKKEVQKSEFAREMADSFASAYGLDNLDIFDVGSTWPFHRRIVRNPYPAIWRQKPDRNIGDLMNGVITITEFEPVFNVAADVVNGNGKVLKRVTFRIRDLFFQGDAKEFKSAILGHGGTSYGINAGDASVSSMREIFYEQFFTINVNDMTDNFTVRIVSVNGQNTGSVIRNGSVGIPRESALLTGVDRSKDMGNGYYKLKNGKYFWEGSYRHIFER